MTERGCQRRPPDRKSRGSSDRIGRARADEGQQSTRASRSAANQRVASPDDGRPATEGAFRGIRSRFATAEIDGTGRDRAIELVEADGAARRTLRGTVED